MQKKILNSFEEIKETLYYILIVNIIAVNNLNSEDVKDLCTKTKD